MADSVRSYINRNNLLEVKGDNPTESNPANKSSARSSGSAKSSISSPSQQFIQFIDKIDMPHEPKEKKPGKTKADVFYGKNTKGKPVEGANENSDSLELKDSFAPEVKFSSMGVQTTPQESFYNRDIRPLPLTDEKRRLDIDYKGLNNMNRLKLPAHYSDIRVAYRRYAEMLQTSGFSMPLKLFEIKPPPNVKPKLLDETACFTAKKTTKKDTFSIDAAYSEMMKDTKQEKSTDFFTATFVFPELIQKFEDIGNRYVRVDLLKYWKMYSPYFENYEIIFEFLESIELLKRRGELKDIYHQINDRHEAIQGSMQKGHLMSTPAELKSKIRILDEEGLYTSILDHLVANFCVSKAMNARIMDSLYSFIMFEYERLYNSKIEIDSIYFVDSAPIRTIFEIPASTDILFAAKVDNIERGFQTTKNNLLNFKKRNYFVTIKELIKDKWLSNNINESMEKNLPHTDYKPLNHYVGSVERMKPLESDKKYRKSQVETFMVGSVKSSTLSAFLNPMIPTYKPGFSGKGNKVIRDNRAKKINELPHLHKRKKTNHDAHRDAVSRASDETNFIDLDSTSRKPSNHPKSEHLSLTISSKFEELIEKAKHYKQNKHSILKDLNKTFDAYGNPHIIESSTIIEPHLSRPIVRKDSAAFTEEREERDMGSVNRRLNTNELKRLLEKFPKLERKDLIQLYSKFLTLAELSLRKQMLEEKKNMVDKNPFSRSRARNTSFDSNSTSSSYHTSTRTRTSDIDLTSLNLTSLVDIEILTAYTEYFSERPDELNQDVIKASALGDIPDPNGVVSWESFVNMHVILIMGRGEKDQNINFLVNFFCPSKDKKIVPKQQFIRKLGEIVSYNPKYNSSPEMVHEVCTSIWNGDLLASGCVENHTNLLKDNLKKALDCDKIFSETFMVLINPELEEENRKNDDSDEY